MAFGASETNHPHSGAPYSPAFGSRRGDVFQPSVALISSGVRRSQTWSSVRTTMGTVFPVVAPDEADDADDGRDSRREQ
jgi:hypothetical protein